MEEVCLRVCHPAFILFRSCDLAISVEDASRFSRGLVIGAYHFDRLARNTTHPTPLVLQIEPLAKVIVVYCIFGHYGTGIRVRLPRRFKLSRLCPSKSILSYPGKVLSCDVALVVVKMRDSVDFFVVKD